MPEVYARVWRVAAGAQGPVTCKDCCREFDLGFEPRAVEGMRGKLKRLVERGHRAVPGQVHRGRGCEAGLRTVTYGPRRPLVIL